MFIARIRTMLIVVGFAFYIRCAVADNPAMKYIEVCDKNVTDMELCVLKSLDKLRNYLADGLLELNIPKVEPMSMGDLVISEKSVNGLSIITNNILAYGASNLKIIKINVTEYGKRYYIQAHIPHLYVTGTYTADGRLILIDIRGSGKFSGNFTNCLANSKVIIEETTKGGVRIQKYAIRVRVESAKMAIDNLFDGNKELVELVNQAINKNFNIYSREVIPFIERSLARKFIQIGNDVLSRFTYDEVFPQ